MLGLFGLFGRAAELERLDLALRAAGLHPRAIPDAVKLTTVKLLKEGHGTDAGLVLLTMHAGLIHPNVVERHQLTME